MSNISPYSIGGQLTAKLLRKRSIEKYNKNPVICLNCKKPIPLKGRRPSKVKKNKFCSQSCSATFNNSMYPKRESKYHKSPTSICKICGNAIPLKKRSKNTYYKRIRCDKCKNVKGSPPLN